MFAAVVVAVSCSALAAAAWQLTVEVRRTAAEVRSAAASLQADWTAAVESVQALQVCVQAAERRQDTAEGLQRDIGRHVQQALVEYCSELGPVLWLRRQLQTCLESCCRRAALHGVDPEALWTLQCTEAQLVCCRDLLLQPEDEDLLRAVRNCRLPGLPASLWRPLDLQQTPARLQVAAGGHWLPLEVQVADRVEEVMHLMQSVHSEHPEVVASCVATLELTH